MRKTIVLIAVSAVLGGCLTVQTEATRENPETGDVWTGKQTARAFAGGKAEAAEQQFVMELVTDANGERAVKVNSGNNVTAPSTPNTIKDVADLLQGLGVPEIMKAAMTPPPPELPPPVPTIPGAP